MHVNLLLETVLLSSSSNHLSSSSFKFIWMLCSLCVYLHKVSMCDWYQYNYVWTFVIWYCTDILNAHFCILIYKETVPHFWGTSTAFQEGLIFRNGMLTGLCNYVLPWYFLTQQIEETTGLKFALIQLRTTSVIPPYAKHN